MSRLPAGWRLTQLSQVADTALGKMLDRGKDKGHAEVPYLRNLNVQWGRISTDDVLTMQIGAHELSRYAVEDGDLLVCEGGEVGRCAIWRGDHGYLAYQKALHRVRPHVDVDIRYLRYLLELYAGDGTLKRHSTGSTIAHLPQQRLKELPVPLPPQLSQQKAIVELLEDTFTRLDSAAAGLRITLRRVSAYEASFLTACREGEDRVLGEVAAVQGGIQKQQKRAPKSNSHPFLRVANVTARGLELSDVHRVELFAGELERLRLEEGDLLVVEGNGSPSQIGRAALWNASIPNCVHQNHLIRVRALPGLHPSYLEAVWNSPKTRHQLTELASSSSGLYTLSVSKLKSLRIPIPDVDRQEHLVRTVSEMRDRSRRLKVEIIAAEVRTGRLRQSLLSAAFSGRLTGRQSDLDLAEEMISV